MKYGVVGAGPRARDRARVAAELREEGMLDEVVLCERDDDRALELADRFDLPLRTDVDELSVDAATVAAPAATRHEVATRLVEDGIDLLVAAPIAPTAADAHALVEAATEDDRTLAAGHAVRHHPAVCELERRIARGELGELAYLQTNRFSSRVPRRTDRLLDSPVVDDVDGHEFLLASDPRETRGRLDSVVRDDEPATLVFDYGPATAVVNASWQAPELEPCRHLIVVGTDRTAFVDYRNEKRLELYETRRLEGTGTLPERDAAVVHEADGTEPLKAELIDFLHAAETGGEPKVPGRLGVETVETLERVHTASVSGSDASTTRPVEERT